MEISKILDSQGNIIGMTIDGVIQKKPFPIENTKRKEKQTMTKQVRVLEARKMEWKKPVDCIDRVRSYLQAHLSPMEAQGRLRKMSGLEVLELCDTLGKGETPDANAITGTAGKKVRVLQAPKMKW